MCHRYFVIRMYKHIQINENIKTNTNKTNKVSAPS